MSLATKPKNWDHVLAVLLIITMTLGIGFLNWLLDEGGHF